MTKKSVSVLFATVFVLLGFRQVHASTVYNVTEIPAPQGISGYPSSVSWHFLNEAGTVVLEIDPTEQPIKAMVFQNSQSTNPAPVLAYFSPYGLNDSGWIVGEGSVGGNTSAYLYRPGIGLTDLGPGTAYAVNNAGEVAGQGEGNYPNDPTWRSSNGATPVELLDSFNLTEEWVGPVNASGVIVAGGKDDQGKEQTYLCGSTTVSIGAPAGDIDLGAVWPILLNDAGHVAIFGYDSAIEAYFWFLYNGSSWLRVPGLSANATVEIAAMNSQGTAVGYSNENALSTAIKTDGVTTTALQGSLGGAYSEAYDINDSGVIVGEADNAFGNSGAFVDFGSGMVRLDTLTTTSGWDLFRAWRINNAGQILAYGRNPKGRATYCLLTPTTPGLVETPTISPNGGNFTKSTKVTLACSTAGATIRYSTNGSDPTSTSPVYSKSLTVSATTTIKAKAFKQGSTESSVASATFTFPPPPVVSTPAISPNGGTFSGSAVVTLSSSTSKAAIYFTTDGSTPTLSSPKYSKPFVLTSSATVKAKAFRAGWTESAETSSVFTINPLPPAETPVIAPSGGTFSGSTMVTLSTTTPSAQIRFTTNGAEPTASSTRYTKPLALTKTTTLKAKAFGTGFAPSATATATFTRQ